MQRTCYRCATVDPYPVLIRIIERNTGPSAGVYACPSCAQLDYREHHKMCHVCSIGERCQTNMDMRSAMLAARRLRLAGS